MKWYNILIVCSVIICSVTNCASQKFEKSSPMQIQEIYKHHWISGVKGGGSGTNIFVRLESAVPETIVLDSIYFGDLALALKPNNNNPLLYVGRDIKESKKNYNTLQPAEVEESPAKAIKFDLEPNECVLQYRNSEAIKYVKYDSLYTKKTPLAPRAKPKH